MRRAWRFASVLGALGASIGLVRFVAHHHGARDAQLTAAPRENDTPALVHVDPVARDEARERGADAPIAGLDLTKIAADAAGSLAHADPGTARLTIDSDLQRTALGLMAAHHLPEGAVVLMDAATGHLLVYASRADEGPERDLCADATAPSASVFKIITASALVEDAHLESETKQCYSGGEQRIAAADLIDDPARDRWCTTLAGALGRSINTVFARLANRHLSPRQLEAMARRFGYGEPFAFDVPVQVSQLHVPAETLDFARTAAGFWNTTLSPLQAAEISAIVARGGETVRPSAVEKIVSDTGAVVWAAPDFVFRRAITRETAAEVARMMEHTVNEGTSWHAFHDGRGRPFLPGIAVAGKTGTLTDGGTQRFYTWFTGFAPAHPVPGVRQVAVSALVVNGLSWQIKANVLARDVLRAYFAEQGVEGVSRPSIATVARLKAH